MKSTSKTFNKVQVDHIVHHDSIEYKKVDPNRFSGYTVNQIQVQQDNNGYVNSDLLNEFSTKDTCTTIVNVGIGQGKTTAVYEYIKQLTLNDDLIVVLASPFVTLVEKDLKTLTEEHKIDPKNILVYLDLETEKKDALNDMVNVNYAYAFDDQNLWLNEILPNKKIHIITINSLLGNPGDSAFIQSTEKHDYLAALFKYCKASTKRIVFILDEIHESVHNFANPFIYNIIRWKDLTHKAILLTATYTESVNIIVKHFAYLTDDIINIIESDRIKKSNQPANLHLCYTNKTYSTHEIDELEIIKYVIEQSDLIETTPRQVQILSFSKRIARAIYDVSDEWIPNRDVKLSIGSSSEKFDPNSSNIGTTFKTGVNITTKDLFFIVLPCKYTTINFKGEYGIFSDGVPSIIQSIARMRTDGDIYVIIPPVPALIKDEYLEEYLPLQTHQLSQPKIMSEIVKDDYTEFEKIYKLIYQRIELTEKVYNINTLTPPITVTRPNIQYPKLDTFILERGQQFLVDRFFRHGKFISPYIIRSAFHDQFVNTNLLNVYTHSYDTIELKLTLSSLFEELDNFLEKTAVDINSKKPLEIYTEIQKTIKHPIINSKLYDIDLSYNGEPYPAYPSITIGQLHIASYVYYQITGRKMIFTTKKSYLNFHISIAKRNKRKLNTLGKAYSTISSIVDNIDMRITKSKLKHVPKIKINSILPKIITPAELKKLKIAVDEINTNDPLISTKFAFFKGVDISMSNIERVYNHLLLNFFIIGTQEVKIGPNQKIKGYLYLGVFNKAFDTIIPPKSSFLY